MWWECSECGSCAERIAAPLVCRECGVAGPIFVPAEVGLEGDPEVDSLRMAWLRAGLDRVQTARV